MKLRVDPEFRDLLPPLTDDELSELEANLKADGCLHPVIGWAGIVVDGHNRQRICDRNKIPYEVIEREFADRDAAIRWVIRHHMGRRNLSDYAKVNLALKLKPAIEVKANERMKSGKPDPRQTFAQGRAIDEVAKVAGVSSETVRKVEVINAEATPEIKEQLEADEISINRAYQETRKKPTPKKTRGANADSIRLSELFSEITKLIKEAMQLRPQKDMARHIIDEAIQCGELVGKLVTYLED